MDLRELIEEKENKGLINNDTRILVFDRVNSLAIINCNLSEFNVNGKYSSNKVNTLYHHDSKENILIVKIEVLSNGFS